jgi:hypothetical protein
MLKFIYNTYIFLAVFNDDYLPRTYFLYLSKYILIVLTILSAYGGFLFSQKSVARRALHPFIGQNAPFPPPKKKLPQQRSPYWLVIEQRFGWCPTKI